MATRKSRQPASALVPLSSVQVDVATRLGALTPATTTGFGSLDRLLGGGIRAGTHLLVTGQPGTGKTAFALLLAYVAARSRAGVVFTSVALDDTEVVARLTSRALHREYNNVDATYGTIWSGEAMQDPALRGPISGCLNSVIKKVGGLLHLHGAEPLEPVGTVAERAAQLRARHDRVVVVVDGIEGFSPTGAPGTSHGGRVAHVAHELRRLAADGCAVVTTCLSTDADLVSPAATIAGELVPSGSWRAAAPATDPLQGYPVDFVVAKNRLGPTGRLPFFFVPAASMFEERTS